MVPGPAGPRWRAAAVGLVRQERKGARLERAGRAFAGGDGGAPRDGGGGGGWFGGGGGAVAHPSALVVAEVVLAMPTA